MEVAIKQPSLMPSVYEAIDSVVVQLVADTVMADTAGSEEQSIKAVLQPLQE